MTDTTTAGAGSANPSTTAAGASPSATSAVIEELTGILGGAVALAVTNLSLTVMVALPGGGSAYLGAALTKPTAPPTSKTGSIADILSTVATAIADDASNLSETMTVEAGYLCQVGLTRC